MGKNIFCDNGRSFSGKSFDINKSQQEKINLWT